MGRPGGSGARGRAARRRRAGRRRARHGHGDEGTAARGLQDDARLALHRSARRGAGDGGARVRRSAPVRQSGPRPGRSPRLRILRRLSHEPRRHARRRGDRPYGSALHRREGDPRARPQSSAVARRGPLAGHRPGRRGPPHGGRGERTSEGRGGARPADRLAALRALPRRRAAHDPLPLPPPDAAHTRGRGGGRHARTTRRHRACRSPPKRPAPRKATSTARDASPRTRARGRAERRC